MSRFYTLIISILFITPLFGANAEIAFISDLSASANGVVPHLQTSIWSIVNDMDNQDKFESVKFGFVGTGRKSYGKENNYTKVVSDLNSNLNDLGYELLKTLVNVPGCDAYYHVALDKTINELSWSKDENTSKIIFIIGNGGIRSNTIKKLIKKAKKDKFKIVTIYFNTTNNFAEQKSWEKFSKENKLDFKVASTAKSKIVFTKNYDNNFIQEAGSKLLRTYIPYGKTGVREFKKLSYNYSEVKILGDNCYEEMLIHQSSPHVQGQYSNWDLIDLYNSGNLNYNTIDKEYLPKYLQLMDESKFLKYMEIKARERKLLVQKIRLELDKQANFKQRKLLKSQHQAGSGGLYNIIQISVSELYTSYHSTPSKSVAFQ